MLTKQQCKSIKKRLIDKEMSVKDLADEIGLTRVYVSNIINQLVSGSDAEEKVLQWYKDSKKKKGE